MRDMLVKVCDTCTMGIGAPIYPADYPSEVCECLPDRIEYDDAPIRSNVSSLVLVADRDRDGIGYTLHPVCLTAVRDMIGDGDGFTSKQRLVEIAPAAIGATCDYSNCTQDK